MHLRTFLLVAALVSSSAALAGPQASELERTLAELRAKPPSAERFANEARVLQYLARAAPGDEDRFRDEGLRLAEEALRQDDRHPGALLWWVAHRGAQASPLNPFRAIRIAKEVEKTLLKLRNVAPDYDSAAADRVLGHLYRVAPPSISVGSMEKAGRHLRSALKRAPAFPGNQLFYAEYLKAMDQCALARTFAEAVLRSPELKNHPWDAEEWSARARAVADWTRDRC